MIQLTLIGNIGNDAVIKDVNGNNAIQFSVAHSESYKNAAGEKVEKTAWVRCTYWKKENTAIAQYLKKGVKVYVSGTPSANGYQDTTSGTVKSSLELRVDRVELLSSATNTGNEPGVTPKPNQQQAQMEYNYDSSLPF